MSELAAIGLLYDIVGVSVLGWAIAIAPDAVLKSQASTYIGFSPAMLEALVQQRVDAKFGLGLLVIGFLLQFLAAVGLESRVWCDGILVLALVTTGIFYLIFRGRLASSAAARLQRELMEKSKRRSRG